MTVTAMSQEDMVIDVSAVTGNESGNEEEKALTVSARSPITGRWQTLLVVIGNEVELMEFVERMKRRVENAFRN